MEATDQDVAAIVRIHGFAMASVFEEKLRTLRELFTALAKQHPALELVVALRPDPMPHRICGEVSKEPVELSDPSHYINDPGLLRTAIYTKLPTASESLPGVTTLSLPDLILHHGTLRMSPRTNLRPFETESGATGADDNSGNRRSRILQPRGDG